MIQSHPKPTTPLTRQPKPRYAALPLMIASGLFAFATALPGQGATVVANGSGSLLNAAAASDRPGAVGALTLNSFDGLIPTTTAPVASFYSAPLSSVVVREESAAFTNLIRAPKATTWFATLVAAGASLLLARMRLARRHGVPVQNT